MKNHSPRRQTILILAGIAIFLIVALLPEPRPTWVGGEAIALSAKGKLCVGFLLVAIFWWVTEALPFHITALLVMMAMPLLRVTDGLRAFKNGRVTEISGIAAGFKEIVKLSFGNDLILFFIGIFLLSGAFSATPLGKRMTLRMIWVMGTETRRVILGFLIMGTLISMWVSDMGVSAMLLPIGVGILRQAGCEPLKSNFGRALMIASCWGAIFGGIGTPAGCGPNPIAIGYMRDLAGMSISFLDWMKLGVPAALVLVPFGWAVLLFLFPPEIERLPMTREQIRSQLEDLGRPSREEIGTVIVFSIVIFLWVFNPLIVSLTGGKVNLSISFVGILGGMLLLLPPFRVMTWERANEAISWESIVLVMASLGLGMMSYHTGAARWLAVTLLGGIRSFSPLALIFVVIFVVLFMKLFLASNTVTGIIIIPILISLAHSFDIHPWILVGPAAFTSSLGIILVTQTPTNVIPYTSGYFSIRDFALSGIIMTLIMSVLLTAVIAVMGPLTGMYAY